MRDAAWWGRARGGWWRAGVPAAACVLWGLAAAAFAQSPEKAWISGEARYNLRRAPGPEYRAVDLVKSGDEVVVLEEAGDWARVRTSSGSEGWIDLPHLQREPPPFARVARLEAELAEAQARVAQQTEAAAKMRTEKESAEGASAREQEKTEALRAENEILRIEARWREWVTGGAIVLVGMILGAIICRIAMRRTSARLRF